MTSNSVGLVATIAFCNNGVGFVVSCFGLQFDATSRTVCKADSAAFESHIL